MSELPVRKPNRRAVGYRIRLAGRTIRDWAIVLFLFAVCGFIAVRLDAVQMRVAQGRPMIVDGDTVTIDGQRVRLSGIDAFERGQICEGDAGAYDCGANAVAALRRLIGGRAVACRGRTFDRYRRLLATCTVAGNELNAAMVDSGWAVAYGDYQAQEARAQATRTGAWAGTFDRPSKWCAARGELDETPHDLFARLVGLMQALLFGPATLPESS
jgi:endonuclease YncB( thermonuclease family)